MNHQMMLVLSIFDLFGSIAYSLTTLPIPKEDYIEGAQGNDATCTAQGFFIQLSTIAGFINVSLSVYYLMIIKFRWNDDRLKKFRIWFYVCPIVTGLAFAFAGIPFYTNMVRIPVKVLAALFLPLLTFPLTICDILDVLDTLV